MQDFDLQNQLIQNRLRNFQSQGYQQPQGQMVGRHFVAPNALQHIAAGLRGYGAIQGEQQAMQELKDLSTQRQTAIANALRKHNEFMTGAPAIPEKSETFGSEEGDFKMVTQPFQAARAPDPYAANMALIESGVPSLQTTGLTGLGRIPELQAAQAERVENRQWRSEESAANRQARLQENQDRIQAQKDINAQRAQDRKDEEERRRQDKRDEEERRRQDRLAAPKNAQVIQTAEGPMILNSDGTVRPITGPTGQQVRGPEKATPLTEGQAKAVAYATRMQNADQILNNLGLSGTNAIIPGANNALMNPLLSKNQQKAVQAQRDFVNAVLRRESGAVISDQEFNNAAKQYFPQVGDSPEVITQKANNRRIAIEGIKADIPQGSQGLPNQIIQGQKPQTGGQRTIVRTGTMNGRKVVQYSDGSTEYAD